MKLITPVTIVKINRSSDDNSGKYYANAEELLVIHNFGVVLMLPNEKS
jgi:hypothetical protein